MIVDSRCIDPSLTEGLEDKEINLVETRLMLVAQANQYPKLMFSWFKEYGQRVEVPRSDTISNEHAKLETIVIES